MPGTGGVLGTGGTATGGITGTGGATGGMMGTGGIPSTGGAPGTGGVTATGGTGGSSADCSASIPTGGTRYNVPASGPAAGLQYSVWSNTGTGNITTYSTPAFSASWSGSGDFLASLGLKWNGTQTYDALGTITAQFSDKKTGSAGGYSYIGVYGWSQNPCIEFYIIDDSYGALPFNPGSGSTNMGTAVIDGGTYNLYTHPTSGTGGSLCTSAPSSWTQFYSIRQTARTCGQISITSHFNAWAGKNMILGAMLEAVVQVEVGGGTGSIDFPIASVTAQ
jgi:hypothetical protein